MCRTHKLLLSSLEMSLTFSIENARYCNYLLFRQKLTKIKNICE